MPTTYTHWRFGEIGHNKLDEPVKKIIDQYREYFDFGVHGPDMFFYYRCYKYNDVNKFGYHLHWDSFKMVLERLKPGYLASDNKEAALAYILGFAAHFSLDSYCHSYIEKKETYSDEIGDPISHGRIESQFDKYLMIKDGFNPIKKKAYFSLKPKRNIAHIISELFTNFSEKVLYDALKDMKMYLFLLNDNTDFKRWITCTVLDAVKGDKYKDLLITKKEYPNAIDSNMRLEKLFNKALIIYPDIVKSTIDFLDLDKPLPKYFDNTFEYKDNYKEIPILSKEEEEKYEVDFEE